MLRLVSVLAMHRLPSETADPPNDMGVRAAASEGVLGRLPERHHPSFAAARWIFGLGNDITAPSKMSFRGYIVLVDVACHISMILEGSMPVAEPVTGWVRSPLPMSLSMAIWCPSN